MIRPGETIGILGGGQLGKMLAVPARQLGYGIAVLAPEGDAPAAGLADYWVRASFEDDAAALKMAERCSVITYEFENVPASTVRALQRVIDVRPGANVLAITQDRLVEHEFIHKMGIPTAPGRAVRSSADLMQAMTDLGLPMRLKTARGGYDGGGQWRICSAADVPTEVFNGAELLVEREVGFQRELSVVLVRNQEGEIVCFPVFENRHHQGILIETRCPAQISPKLALEAQAIARTLAEGMQLIGTLTVEMFEVDGRLLVNELAPRVHNSGHLSIEACTVSQFEQHIRAVCGLPLRPVSLRRPAVMVNVLGESSLRRMRVEGLEIGLALPETYPHIYGKTSVRPRRKMGHVTAVADTLEEAHHKAHQAATALRFCGL